MGMWWYSSHWMATHHHISKDCACSSHYLGILPILFLVTVDNNEHFHFQSSTWSLGIHAVEMAASGGISAPHTSEPRIITLLRGKEESEDS